MPSSEEYFTRVEEKELGQTEKKMEIDGRPLAA